MACLLDTNVLLRVARKNDPERPTVLSALRKLSARGEEFCYTTQVLGEFWNVCTRPHTARGGLGLSVTQTERKAHLIERYCRLLPDSLATHREWRRLIVAHAVAGVAVHDARLVAAMRVHGVNHLLTFNVGDFKRYIGITAVSPTDVH
jgi:predicted nucleic acid-binding protein